MVEYEPDYGYAWLGPLGPFPYDKNADLQEEADGTEDPIPGMPDKKQGFVVSQGKVLDPPEEDDDAVRKQELDGLEDRVGLIEGWADDVKFALDGASVSVSTASQEVVTSISITKDEDGFVTNVSYNTTTITYVTGVTLNIDAPELPEE